LVVGVGSCWPHDFRFFTGFFSGSCLASVSSGVSRTAVVVVGMKLVGEQSREDIELAGDDAEYSERLWGVWGVSSGALANSVTMVSRYIKSKCR